MKTKSFHIYVSIIIFLALVSFNLVNVKASTSTTLTTITVNSNGDLPDLDGGIGTCETEAHTCTLRAAIQTAEYSAGADVITVNASLVVIGPETPLPSIGSGDLTILGNGIYLSGLNLKTDGPGFEIASNNNKIQGFNIFGFQDGIRITDGENNIIGCDGDGVNDAAEKNKIYNNGDHGVYIFGSDNRVSGNFIGTDNGSSVASNRYGVMIAAGTGNLIGTDGNNVSDSLERNIVSGNTIRNIIIQSNNNRVAGNYIGVNETGTKALWVDNVPGIYLDTDAAGNIIGTNSDGVGDNREGNLISGNDTSGVSIQGDYNRVMGNVIGLDATGSLALGNGTGVSISSSGQNNFIGTDYNGVADAYEKNIISGNTGPGVLITGIGATDNKIAGNVVGLNASGTLAIGNQDGVKISTGAYGNQIGSVLSAGRNVISGNTTNGVNFYESGEDNVLIGNYIGTDSSGTTAKPNLSSGVYINQSPGNTIGGSAAGSRNIISGNSGAGIQISYDNADNTIVKGNYIGTTADGLSPLGNGTTGISVGTDTTLTFVGGVLQGEGNLIAFNGSDGVKGLSNAVGIMIRGNSIHSNAGLGIYLGAGVNNDPDIPSVTRAVYYPNHGAVHIDASLTGSPNTDYYLDFYLNSVCDPSGEGEGKQFLGSVQLYGNSSGVLDILSLNFPGVFTLGHFITATATNVDGDQNTSQFSDCYPISGTTSLFLPVVVKQ